MSFAKFSSDFLMETYTLVDNLFIIEHLPYLEEKQIKTYIYGLFLCTTPQENNNVDTLCTVLDMNEEELLKAYTDFEGLGLVQIISKSPLEVKYLSLKKGMQPPKKYKAEQWSDFNTHLQLLFPQRMLTPNEYNEYYNFVDSTKIADEAMLMIVKYCINLKGESVRYPYILTVAKNWVADGVKTVGDVESKLLEYESQADDMREVLAALGRKGGADLEEKQMLLKWKRSWGFEQKAIITAAKSLKSGKTFKRLDARLDEFYRANILSSEEMADFNRYREHLNELTIEINKTIGVFYESLDHEIEVYTIPWVTKGFSDDALKKIAHYCFVSGIRTLEGLNNVITKFYSQGYLTVESVNEFIAAGLKQDAKIKEMLEKTGRTRSVTASDREYYRTWVVTWGIDESLILYAAELSANKTYPMTAMNQLLSSWKSSGITTVEEAKRKQIAPAAATREKPSTERTYTPDELQSILRDIDNLDNIDL